MTSDSVAVVLKTDMKDALRVTPQDWRSGLHKRVARIITPFDKAEKMWAEVWQVRRLACFFIIALGLPSSGCTKRQAVAELTSNPSQWDRILHEAGACGVAAPSCPYSDVLSRTGPEYRSEFRMMVDQALRLHVPSLYPIRSSAKILGALLMDSACKLDGQLTSGKVSCVGKIISRKVNSGYYGSFRFSVDVRIEISISSNQVKYHEIVTKEGAAVWE